MVSGRDDAAGRSGGGGPKTLTGKRRSSGNARKYSFTSGHTTTPLAEEHIKDVAQALLDQEGDHSEEVLLAAREAAVAIHTVDLIRLHRERLLRDQETREQGRMPPAELAGNNLKAAFSTSPAERNALPNRGVFPLLMHELERLDRYEANALVKRRKLLRTLDGLLQNMRRNARAT